MRLRKVVETCGEYHPCRRGPQAGKTARKSRKPLAKFGFWKGLRHRFLAHVSLHMIVKNYRVDSDTHRQIRAVV
jgi:hypothetical protein